MLISKYLTDNTDMEKEISAFEAQYHLELPEAYRKFMLKYNGGDTPDTKFRFGKISSDIRAFLGIGDVTYSMPDSSGLKEWIGKKCLPIAVDSFGNYVVIGLEKGEIFFSDHERDYKCTKLTDSLEDFILCCKSKKIGKILSVEEREQMIRKNGFTGEISDLRLKLWREEIEEYQRYKQEKLILD